MTFFAIQLFWISIVFIGLVTLLLCSNKLTHKSPQLYKGLAWLRTLPLLSLMPIGFGVGLLTLAVIGVPSYIFTLPIWLLMYWYIFVLAVSAMYALVRRRQLIRHLRGRATTRISLFFSAVAFVVLGIDFAFASRLGGSLISTDVYIQLAKVHHFIAVGNFSFTDPYFGLNGVSDVRYSANTLNAMQTVAVKLFGTDPISVYWYSYGFYRIIMWLMFFTLAWVYAEKNHKEVLSYAVLILMPFIAGDFFRYIELPDRIVLVWTAIVLIGIKLLLEGKGPLLLYIGVVLTALTHGLSAAIAIGFILGLGFILLVCRMINRSQVYALLASAGVLAVPFVANLSLPNRISTNPGYFVAGPISGDQLTYSHYGNITIISPHIAVSLIAAIVTIMIIICLYYLKKLRMVRLRLLIYCLLILLFILTLNVSILGFIGLPYLIYSSKQKKTRVLLACLSLYYAAVIYNPLLIGPTEHTIPPWIFSRFQEFNVLAMIAPICGLFLVIVKPLEKWGYHRLAAASLGLVGFILLIYIPKFSYNYTLYQPIYSSSKVNANRQLRNEFKELQSAIGPTTGGVLYSNDLDLPTKLPVVSDNNVLGMNGVNASQSANLLLRGDCALALYTKLSAGDLRAAKITGIVASTQNETVFARAADTSPNLTFQRQSGFYRFYAVNQSVDTADATESICNIPYGN